MIFAVVLVLLHTPIVFKMDKMKAISWDKLRRLVGRKKSKDRDTDSSRFQRSYSFKRASVRKSGRKGTGNAALGAAAIAAAAAAAANSNGASLNDNHNEEGSCNGADVSSSVVGSRNQHEQFHRSNGKLSSCSTDSNNSSAAANKVPKAGYQEVTVNVDVIADGKNILKQEQVFELKLGSRQNDSSADVKVALIPQRKGSERDKYGSSANLCDNNNLVRGGGSKKHSSVVAGISDVMMERCMSPSPTLQSSPRHNQIGRLRENVHGENSSYDDDDDEAIMNKWIRMRNQGGPMGRRQRAENIYRMMAEDDSDYLDEEDLGQVESEADKYRKEMISPVPNRNPVNGNDGRKHGGIKKRSEHQMEADGDVFEDEFYLAMLAESPRPLRRSTDSALSRLTSDSSHSRSRSRLDDNVDYGEGGVGHFVADRVGENLRPSRLLSACSSSALDLVHAETRLNNDNSRNSPHRRRQQSPSVAVAPTPPPQMVKQPPSACALDICSNNNMSPVQNKVRAKRDIHKSSDDLVSDKNSPDSGSYHHHFGRSGKLSKSKHGSGSSVSGSRDELVGSKDISPSPDLHLSSTQHVSYPVGEIHSTSTEMLLSRQPPCSASSSSTCRTALDDPTTTPKSFWWTQKPGSTMTTSSGASKDSGFSLGRSWAWGLAHKVFGKRAHANKGPILSVSKEGYFQRTNLRRASGKRPAYPIPLRSSVTRRSSSKKRRSGRGRRNNVALSLAAHVSNSAGTSSNSMGARSCNNHNNNGVSSSIPTSSPPSPSSPNLVKSNSIDNIINDEDDPYHQNVLSMDDKDVENEIISETEKLAIASTPLRCTSTASNYANNHNENNCRALHHEDSIFEEEPGSIYQTDAVMSRRQRMLQRQQQHQQFQVFATPHSAEPLIFVPPERRKSCHSSAALAQSKKSPQPVPYSKTVFEIRNHCLPLLVPGAAGPRLDQEPVELLRLPRLRCDKKSCEKSILITKVSGPYDNDGRLSRASCASGASSSNGINSHVGDGGVGGDCCQQSGVGHSGNSKLGDCLDHLSPCGSPGCANIRNSNNVGRRSSSTSHHNSHHQIKPESDIDCNRVGGCGINNKSRRDCKIRDKLPSNSINDGHGGEFEDVHYEANVNRSHQQYKNNFIDEDLNAVEDMLRKGGYLEDDDEDECEVDDADKSRPNLNPGYVNENGKAKIKNCRGMGTNVTGINSGNNAVRRKQSTRRTNNNHHQQHHNRPSKVITKPSAVAVYRRYSTLYRRAKLSPNFALPRPTIKSGECY